MDDPDDISITSTVPSEPVEEYEVDGILAERDDGAGSKLYLVQWQGYPLHRCTWEPSENFGNEETFEDWEHGKHLIQQGERLAFDLEAFETECAWHDAETRQRKVRRQAKRRRLALEKDSDDDRPLVQAPRPTHSNRQDSGVTYEGTSQKPASSITKQRPEAPQIEKKGPARPVSSSGQGKVGSSKALPPCQGPASTKENRLGFLKKSNQLAKTSIKSAPSSGPRSRVQGADVLKNWDAQPKRKVWGLGDSWQKTGDPEAHKFKKMSTAYRFYKYGRNEPAPNADSLTFVNLQDGKALPAAEAPKGTVHKSPFQLIQEKLATETAQANKPQDVLADQGPIPDDGGSVLTNEERIFVQSGEAIIHSPDKSESLDVGNTDMPDAPDVTNQDKDTAISSGYSGWLAEPPTSPPRPHVATQQRSGAVVSHEAQHGTLPNTLERRSDPEFNRAGAQDMNAEPSRMGVAGPGWVPALMLQDIIGDAGVEGRSSGNREDVSDIYGQLVWDDSFCKAMLRGLQYHVRRVLTAKILPRTLDFEMNHVCSASEYLDLYHEPRPIYYGAGHILPKPRSETPFRIISDRLRSQDRGAVGFAEHFSAVIWPTGLQSWDRFDAMYPKTSAPSHLRILIRSATEKRSAPASAPNASSLQPTTWPQYLTSTPNSQTAVSRHPSLQPQLAAVAHSSSGPPPQTFNDRQRRASSSNPNQQPLGRTRGGFDTPRAHSIALSVPPSPAVSLYDLDDWGTNIAVTDSPLQAPTAPESINMADLTQSLRTTDRQGAIKVFQDQFHFKYKDLLPDVEKDSGQPVNFFLQFPEAKKDEHDALVTFLQSVNAKYYSSFQPGEWKHFSSNIGSGVILIHQSFTDIRKMFNLSNVLWSGTINIWQTNLRGPASGNRPFVQIFPQGATIVLSDSVFLKEPENVRRCFTWFRKKQLPSRLPGTWKLVTRPRVREWLLALIEARSKQGKDLEAQAENLGEEETAVQAKKLRAEAKLYLQIFQELDMIAPLTDMDEHDDFQTPLEKASYVSASYVAGFDLELGKEAGKTDDDMVNRNDELLVQWYGPWTLNRFHTDRRFLFMFHGSSDLVKQWRNEWGHIYVDKAEKTLKTLQVNKWEDESRKNEARKKRMADEKNIIAQAEEAIALLK